MKFAKAKREDGNTLFLALIMCLTIGTVLASYMTLMGTRYKMTLRSRCWNASMPVVEAGIEEAMTHLHDDMNNPAVNGWTLGTISGQPVYSKRRDFANNGGYYLVNIYNAANIASNLTTIYSTGFIPTPINDGTYISRTVRIKGTNPPLVNVAFAAINGIQMNGNGLSSDSFDSSNPGLSNNGQYDSSKTTNNGNVASVNGPVNLGNHTVGGNLFLGPSAVSAVTPGQVTGSIYTDFNVSFPDAALPSTTWVPKGTTVVSGTPTYDFTTSGDYSVSAGNNIQVEAGVSVRVRVDTTSFNPASIHILTTNGNSGSLVIYQVSGTMSMSGNTSVDSGRAQNFYYYGLPGVTNITYGGNSSFVGVIYAPEADLTLNGGGNNVGVIGSSITKSITMNGHYDFHFDQNLLNSGPGRGFVANQWTEL